MKNILLYFLAAVGVFNIVYIIIDVVQHQQAAKLYSAGCSRVQIGMTLAEAQEVMGYDYNPVYRGEIRSNLHSGLPPAYFVRYPNFMLASEAITIGFDPVTQRITGVNCGKD